jgi:anti-anti-sigma factor
MTSTDTRADVLVFGDEALISVHGELDLFSIDVLREALADVPQVSRVVIDLQAVGFLDCSVLRFIEDAAKQYAADSRKLLVEHASGLVNRLIEILKLDDLRVR